MTLNLKRKGRSLTGHKTPTRVKDLLSIKAPLLDEHAEETLTELVQVAKSLAKACSSRVIHKIGCFSYQRDEHLHAFYQQCHQLFIIKGLNEAVNQSVQKKRY